MTKRLLAATLVLLASGCRSGEPAPSAAPPASSTAPAASTAGPGAAAALAPLPDLGSRTKLELHQGQGGPSLVRCNGVVSELELDLVTNDWTYGVCEARGKPGSETASLTKHKGRLSSADREKVEAAYRSVRVTPSPRCANDAGLSVLTLRGADGAVERYSCREPFSVSGGALTQTLLEIVNASMFP